MPRAGKRPDIGHALLPDEDRGTNQKNEFRIPIFMGVSGHHSVDPAARLAELSRAGELKAIRVLDEAHEAMRIVQPKRPCDP